MSVAYNNDTDGGFENKALQAYHERARLTRLLTLQQSLLSHVMQADGAEMSLTAIIEKVRQAFAADGLIIALDRSDLQTAVTMDDHVGRPTKLAQLLRSESVPVELARRLGALRSIEGCDGPVQPDALTYEKPFSWFWAEAIPNIQGANLSTSGGRIVFLFNEERTPNSEDRLAMRSVGPHIQMVLHSIMQDRAIASANERFSKLASTIPGVVYQRRVRPDGDIRYTYISETAEELFGVSAHEILTNPSALFANYAPEYGDTFRKRLLEASRTMTTWDVEASIVMPSGERKYTHAIARPEREADGSVLWTGVILDATRMKLAEMAATETEARTRQSIIDSLPQGFMLFDADEKLVLRNKHFDKVLPGYAAAAHEGATYQSILRAELSLGIDGAKTEAELEERFNERMRRHNEMRYTSVERQASEDHWLLIGEKRTDDGGTVMLFTNINEVKQQEKILQQHAERLERANAELQQFAYVASHDLQEPLRKIEAFGDRLITRCGDQLDDNGRLYTDRMMNASGRMRQLINDLLSYSRVGTQEPITSQTDLAQIAHDVVNDLEETIAEKSGRIDIGSLPVVQADPMQMRQLFQNLLSNSIKYSDPERPPIVEIHHELTDDGMCHLQFTDNGIGFQQQHAERIFEVFQRLHGRSEFAGTGIGLATCRRIVDRHNGKISAISEPGVGSLFSLVVPIKQPETESLVGGEK